MMFLVFTVCGGLALFIFGMHTMTDGLKTCAGSQLRRILARATRNKVSGLGFGTLLGLLVQSTAATVMLGGFVNAGLITLPASIPVMLGANIGTTFAAQLISFRLADYCFAGITLGLFIMMAGVKERIKSIGNALLGFGLLFLGMSIITGAITPYRDTFAPLFEHIDGATVYGMTNGILLSTAVTIIIQSSSAMIGISFALIEAGVITGLPGVFPVLIGANIGTCVTVLFTTFGSSADARRSAASHLVFNVFSGAAAALTAPLFYKWIPLTHGDLIHQAANANTIKMIVTAVPALMFMPAFTALLRKLVPSKQAPAPVSFLDETLFPTPEQAIHAVMRELQRTVNLCRDSLALDQQLLRIPANKLIRAIHQNEKNINAVKLAILDYIQRITSRVLSRRQTILLQHLDRCNDEVERIGDHLAELCDLTEDVRPYIKRNVCAPCWEEIQLLYGQIGIILNNLSVSLDPDHENYEQFAERILTARDEYVEKSVAIKDNITERAGKKNFPPMLGIYLTSMITACDKIAKHSKTIAGAQKKPFFWLKTNRLDRLSGEYSEKQIFEKLDSDEYLDSRP
ncbi:MAG: Na/Pi symporter [Kiritimatiellales bacterium]